MEATQPYNDGHAHEALHTVYVLQDTFNNHVLESTCAGHFPDVKTAAEKVMEGLADLYRLIGQKSP